MTPPPLGLSRFDPCQGLPYQAGGGYAAGDPCPFVSAEGGRIVSVRCTQATSVSDGDWLQRIVGRLLKG